MTNIKSSPKQAVNKIVQPCACREKDDSLTDVLLINFSSLHTTWGTSGTRQMFKHHHYFPLDKSLAKSLTFQLLFETISAGCKKQNPQKLSFWD